MSVELIGTGSAGRMVLENLPAMIKREAASQLQADDADPSCLCLIGQVEDQLFLWDLGGKDGTFVNGTRVRRATLKDSDTLAFGGSEFRVHSAPASDRYLHGVRS